MEVFTDFEVLDERTLMQRKQTQKSGTMPIPGSEGAARRDVAHAGFRRSGPIRNPEVEKSGSDVPIWVRTHRSPADYAAHTAKQKHQEGEKVNTKELRRQFHQTGAKKDTPVHDITVGSPKSKVKEPGQRARQFVSALKDVKTKMTEKGEGIATNTPTALSSSGKKRKRSDEEGAEQRGRIYKKLGMGERNPQTGVQMAKIGEGKTFQEFMILAEMRKEDKVSGKEKTPLYLSKTHKTIQSAPEGSGKKWERKDIKVKRPNPEATMGRIRQGMSATPGEPTYHGYTGRGAGYGYKQHTHGIGGEGRGVKRTSTIEKRKGKPDWEPGVDTRTPAQKVADKRAKAAYKGYKYK